MEQFQIMKILYLLNAYPNIHKIVAHDEMLELWRRGHTIMVVSNYPGVRELIESVPFQIVYLKHRFSLLATLVTLLTQPIRLLKFLRLARPYLGFVEALCLFDCARQHRLHTYDRIHTHFISNAALKGYLLGKFFDIPFSATSHGTDILIKPIPELKDLIANATLFFTISEYNKQYLISNYGVSPVKVIVNYCGVDLELFNPFQKTTPEIFTLISVSGLRPVKGIPYLIETCRILTKNNLAFRCLVIGDGPDRPAIEALIRQYNLSSQVFLLGAVAPEQIKDYLQDASVFVLPSLSEGIPVAVMEAMAMQLPVIATNITGLPEIITDGVNGYLVPPKDPQAMAERIIELYHNPEKCAQFGKAARQTVEEKFNLKKNVTRFEKLLLALRQ